MTVPNDTDESIAREDQENDTRENSNMRDHFEAETEADLEISVETERAVESEAAERLRLRLAGDSDDDEDDFVSPTPVKQRPDKFILWNVNI